MVSECIEHVCIEGRLLSLNARGLSGLALEILVYITSNANNFMLE